jgi:hypothetical protein
VLKTSAKDFDFLLELVFLLQENIFILFSFFIDTLMVLLLAQLSNKFGPGDNSFVELLSLHFTVLLECFEVLHGDSLSQSFKE